MGSSPETMSTAEYQLDGSPRCCPQLESNFSGAAANIVQKYEMTFALAVYIAKVALILLLIYTLNLIFMFIGVLT